MAIIIDKGTWRNRVNDFFADIVSIIFGRRINYTLRYYHHRKRLPSFRHPKDLSERVLSSMLKESFLNYADYADKVKVQNYVREKGLGHILLKQYAYWKQSDDIDFSILPSRFILKTNNGCGGHFVCTDKTKIEEKIVRQLMAEDMDVTKLARTEPHYAKIDPLIFAEELMGDGINLPEDYKFYCINGKVDHVMVICERKDGGRKVITLDKNWTVLNYVPKDKMPDKIPTKPSNFDVMVEYAERLSSDFEFVRVDLYDVEGRIYFGELTFSPNGGLFYSYTTEAIDIIGSHFK